MGNPLYLVDGSKCDKCKSYAVVHRENDKFCMDCYDSFTTMSINNAFQSIKDGILDYNDLGFVLTVIRDNTLNDNLFDFINSILDSLSKIAD